MTTRTSFVVKKLDFPPQIGDENRARRHNKAFLISKWRRPTFKLLLSMCKILLEGQMSGKKWEDALSFKCT
ncbi:hypothetical protein, partial [Caldibacillus thermoamylovorans]|uniref:hypothetical protein n=1 Tax=Caldibacillus thermoamylovorans TaxID=35841 RepID=UPI001F25F058